MLQKAHRLDESDWTDDVDDDGETCSARSDYKISAIPLKVANTTW